MSTPLPSAGFSGLWIPLVTPFRNDGAVDHAALRALVQRLRAGGIAGVVVCGSTGEAAALDVAEQDAVLDTLLDAAAGTPVIAGLAGNHTGHLHARLRHLNTLPLAAVLSPAPYYVRPSQEGLVAHFQALADASRAPLLPSLRNWATAMVPASSPLHCRPTPASKS